MVTGKAWLAKHSRVVQELSALILEVTHWRGEREADGGAAVWSRLCVVHNGFYSEAWVVGKGEGDTA